MQLIIKDNTVLATYPNSQRVDLAFLDRHHPDCEAVAYEGGFALDPEGDNADPRSEAQKALAYRDRRRAAYPPIGEQLDMIYHDQILGTTAWRDEITRIKNLYPKPSP